MLTQNDRAFKEWAVACEAIREGRQTLLIRKGGIREEGGEFVITDREFFLMPTYEHQNARLLRPEVIPRLREIESADRRTDEVNIDTYVTVDTIGVAKDESQITPLLDQCIWNEEYVRMRFDFNPYDPLYVVLLRAYRLPQTARVPMRPDYEGCKSWVTLDNPISTAGSAPAVCNSDLSVLQERMARALGKGVL